MKKFLLYEKEKEIMHLCNNIMSVCNYSKHDLLKKKYELFHLLVYLDILHIRYSYIIPNEPGDFIIKVSGTEIMVELTRAFGAKEENKYIDYILNNLFKNKYSSTIKFRSNNMKESILKAVNDKQSKEYKFDKKILLIITAEYDNCSNTGSWVFKSLKENEIKNLNKFDSICILNYFSSGKDNGPTVINDLFKEFYEYKQVFNFE